MEDRQVRGYQTQSPHPLAKGWTDMNLNEHADVLFLNNQKTWQCNMVIWTIYFSLCFSLTEGDPLVPQLQAWNCPPTVRPAKVELLQTEATGAGVEVEQAKRHQSPTGYHVGLYVCTRCLLTCAL